MYVYMYSVIKRLQMFIIHMYVRMDPPRNRLYCNYTLSLVKYKNIVIIYYE